MKNFFSKNWTLKIISFIAAILVWMYIIIVIDPAVDVTIHDIPIQYIEQGKLASLGLSVVDDKTQTLELKVKGSRKKLANIDPSAISATVDLSTVTKVGTHSLPINIVIPYEYNEIVTRKPYSVDVTIDKIIEVRKPITVNTKNSTDSNHIGGEIKVTPSSVLLKGAASVVDRISEAVVVLDYKSAAEDIYTNEEIKFLDKDGNLIPSDSETLKLIITDIDNADVFCPVYELKTVSVKPSYTGAPVVLEDGTEAKIKVTPEAVTLYAPSDLLKSVNEIKTNLFSVSNLKLGDEVTVKLESINGIGICDDIDTVTVKITK